MTAPCRLVLACALALLPLACQKAARYPRPRPPAEPTESKPEAPPPHWAWLPVEKRPDLPLQFIAETSPEWAALPTFWNHYPPIAAGMRTLHLGQPPMMAWAGMAGMALADSAEAIKIKVPRGLPDPTPLIPAANPPSFGRWQLGKKIFAEPVLKAGADIFSCATCHKAGHGYSEPRFVPVGGVTNTLSLLNVVYNRHQFWDGRALALEETLARSLADEQPDSTDNRTVTHRWGSLVKVLAMQPEYREQFQRVFGIEQPTQDTIAKAVATYLRTLLSGDSLYDRAEAERLKQKAPELAAEHFLPHLDTAALRRLEAEKMPKADAAQALARGARLFHGKAQCASCHPGPLFTDHDFHNVGRVSDAGDRFAQVPIGLKEARFIGAYRTPTLRNLPRTEPYFHAGTGHTLHEVVKIFNDDRQLGLAEDEINALVLLLNALDGAPAEEKASER